MSARHEKVRELASTHFIAYEGPVSTRADEEIRAILDAKTIARFAAITTHGDTRYLTVSDTQELAEERAMAYITDSIFPETPIEVIDLDTGDRWIPRWESVQWARPGQSLEEAAEVRAQS